MTSEELLNLQTLMNGIETMWNSMVDAAGAVRARAIAIGFGPEAADQIGIMAFNHVLGLATGNTEPEASRVDHV
jgi:hypothetical protein